MKRNISRRTGLLVLLMLAVVGITDAGATSILKLPYAIVDTGQTACYDTGERGEIPCPKPGSGLFGQDAQYRWSMPSYTDNGDGTITDNVTGLMWQKSFANGIYLDDAYGLAERDRTGGYDDWRVPTIKELYSLILFSGRTGTTAPPGHRPDNGQPPSMRPRPNSMPFPGMRPTASRRDTGPANQPGNMNIPSAPPDDAIPYIDTRYFDFAYPDNPDMRYIDVQFLSTTIYTGLTMHTNRTMFGLNLADGRIKGYGIGRRPKIGGFYLRLVRGPRGYGENDFKDQGDGTVLDRATALTWMQVDSGDPAVRNQLDAHYDDGRLDWPEALSFCENLSYAGREDWRLPDAKELQSIVDYTRSPQATGEPAIDPVFAATPIRDEAGKRNWGFYWTSTTHLDGPLEGGRAVYVAFGEALGTDARIGDDSVIDVHGAGAQRSDHKTGSPDRYPQWGFGPQGDVQRVYNYARCVR